MKVSRVLPEPASCHLQDIKLLAGSQSQQCVIWKASNSWQGATRASILSSLFAISVSICNVCIGILQLSPAVLVETKATVNRPCKCQHFHLVQSINRAARGSINSVAKGSRSANSASRASSHLEDITEAEPVDTIATESTPLEGSTPLLDP